MGKAEQPGMRRGEVLGLRWGDVDLDAARISVRNAIVSVGYKVLESSPKSHQARVIDIDTSTCEFLRELRNRQSSGKADTRRQQDHVLVVSDEDGAPEADLSSADVRMLASIKFRQNQRPQAASAIRQTAKRSTYAITARPRC